MSEGTSFQPVIDDPSIQELEGVKRVVFLSGKAYYDFVKVRSDRGFEGKLALVRVEVSCSHWMMGWQMSNWCFPSR